MKIVCPECGKITTWEGNPDRPFCSKYCKLIDLGAWASEKYRIEAIQEQNNNDKETQQ